MKLMTLEEYNILICGILKMKYSHFQLGFFNSNKILFVGQNPGMPFNDFQREEIKKISEIEKFEDRENAYTEQWKKSLFGTVINTIIDGNWGDVSFTNYVKVPTENNSEPTADLIEEFKQIFDSQCELLKPRIIICFGKFVGRQFGLQTFYTAAFQKHSDLSNELHTTVAMVPHPSYILRSKDSAGSEFLKMKTYIQSLMSKTL